MKEEKKKINRKKISEKIKKTVTKRISKRKNVKDVFFEKETKDKKEIVFNTLEVIIIIFITAVLVSVITCVIVSYKCNKNSTLPSYTTNSDLSEITEAYNEIIDNYVENVDKEGLIDAAISGMYNYLGDEYSVYLDKDNTNTLTEQLNGEYQGIGVEIATEYGENSNTITIHRVFKNSPASEAGLMPNDVLIKLDDTDLSKKDGEYVSNTIKYGEKDTFKLTVLRDEKEVTVELKRANVVIEQVTSETIGNIGYIKLDTFSQTTVKQVKEKIDGFDSNVDSIIIDLRDNTGGLLNVAYELGDLFIEKGKNIYQLKDKNGNITSYEAKEGVYKKFKKIAVLINQSSASASEVLALALKESSNAVIVGTKSYGKGTVQETKSLNSGAMVKCTIAYWLSPNGNSINLIGITPDIEESDTSKQLEKAEEEINNVK